MANIFDKDTGNTDNHLLNEQFHAFSKSPSSPGSTLGGASNRSGHTVSASDVWAEKIPAFFYPKADSDYAVCKANAKLNDICRWGDEIQIWDGEKFVKFADNYAAIPDGHEFLNEDGQPVVRFHKSRVAYNLNDTNNAYDNSLDASGKGASAKILGWDKTANDGAGGVYTYVESAPQFITQFVAPTDNIVKGVPSKGYGPIVMVGGSPLTEDADSTAGYIANNFAGIIQFNERKTQGTVTVHAFEYCGKTLGTTASDIAELEDKLSKISVTAAGGVQAVSNAAKAAGLEINSVDVEGVTTPTLDLTTATITDGIFASTTGNKAKLVTAADVESYVAANAKVSVNGQSATTISVAGTTQGSSDLVKVVVTEDKTKANEIGLTLTATADVATVTSGAITSGHEGKLVKAGDAKAIAEAAANTKVSSVTGPTSGLVTVSTNDSTKAVTVSVSDKLASKDDITLTGIKLNGTAVTPINKIADISAVTDVQSYASNGFEIYTAGKDGKKEIITRIVPAQYDTSSKAWRANGTVTKQYLTTAADVETAISDAISDAKSDIVKQIPSTDVTPNALQTGLKLHSKNNKHYLDVATSVFIEATADKESEWKYTNYLATGASVQAAIGEVKAKINALHETPQFSVVVVAGVTDLTKWKEAVDGGIKKNTIYLVENTDAQDGSYIEYIAYESGAAIVTEKIGTTKTDLSEYAKDADVVKSIATANGVSGSVKNNVATITVQDGTTGQKGLVQLTDTIDATNSSYAVTGKAVASAISSATPKTYNEIKFGYNAVSSGTAATLTSFSGVELIDGVDEDNKPYHKLASGFITAGRYNGAQLAPICNGISSVENCYYTIATSTGTVTGVGLINTMQVIDGSHMFGTNANHDYTKLTNMSYFASPLPILAKAPYMFYYSNLSTFDTALPSITDGSQMFAGSNNLKSFKSDLSTLINGSSMFASCGKLEHFIGDLSSLVHAGEMFAGCKLDEESLMYIADSIKPNANGNYISIGMKNNINTLTANEIEYLNEIHNKGWHVYASGSLYSPIEPSGIMTLDENGEEKFTPIPFWAKAVPCEEKDARYIDNEGNFFTIVGGQLILVDDPETYGMFSCEADAAANMRLTKYVRPVEEETEEAE